MAVTNTTQESPGWRLGAIALVGALIGAIAVHLSTRIEGPLDDLHWLGSLGEWLSGVGTLAAVFATVWLAKRDRENSDKNHERELELLHQQIELAEEERLERRREVDRLAEQQRNAAAARASLVTVRVNLEWADDPYETPGGQVVEHPLRLISASLVNDLGETIYDVEIQMLRSFQGIESGLERIPLGTVGPDGRSIGVRANQPENVLTYLQTQVPAHLAAEEPVVGVVDYTDSSFRRWTKRSDQPARIKQDPTGLFEVT